jgi:radical SAM superfamily enzyme YgiQ (UPF0313 family)
MKIALINPPFLFSSRRESVYSQCLGARYICSYLKAKGGHQVVFIDALMLGFARAQRYANGRLVGLSVPDVVERIPSDTDLIAVSVPFSQLAPIAHEIIEQARGKFPRARIVAGGVYPSTQPALALSSRADMVVVGEGELPLLQLADGKDPAGIAGVYLSSCPPRREYPPAEAVENLDDLPFPDDSIPMVEKYFALSPRMHRAAPTAALVTSRGCPFDCEFCSIHPVCGWKWRARSARNVLEEVSYLNRRHGVRRLEIEDDNFTLSPSRAAEILEGIVRLNEKGARLSWAAHNGLRIETLNDEVIRLMRASNCTDVALGLEHGDAEMLRIMDKRLDLEKALDVIRGLLHARIPRIAIFIIVGYPGETRERFRNGMKYLRRIRALGGNVRPCVNFAQPYPGTRLWKRCVEEGLIADRALDNFLLRKDQTSTEYYVQVETRDFDKEEVLRRKQAINDCFAPAWRSTLKRRLPGAVVRAVRRTKRWIGGHP